MVSDQPPKAAWSEHARALPAFLRTRPMLSSLHAGGGVTGAVVGGASLTLFALLLHILAIDPHPSPGRRSLARLSPLPSSWRGTRQPARRQTPVSPKARKLSSIERSFALMCGSYATVARLDTRAAGLRPASGRVWITRRPGSIRLHRPHAYISAMPTSTNGAPRSHFHRRPVRNGHDWAPRHPLI